MQRHALALATAAAFALFSSTSNAAIVKYRATLSGAQEVPANSSISTGVADLELDDLYNTLGGTVRIELAPGAVRTNQHIHRAPCGVSGDVYLPLPAPGADGVLVVEPPLTLDANGLAALNAGELYINVHTEGFPNGEIRGQILPADSADTCPPTAPMPDAGASPTDAGAPPVGGTPPAPGDDDGCSTTGAPSASNGVVVAMGIAIAAGALTRRRRKA